jgi:hypothetical protein
MPVPQAIRKFSREDCTGVFEQAMLERSCRAIWDGSLAKDSWFVAHSHYCAHYVYFTVHNILRSKLTPVTCSRMVFV